MGGGTGTGAAPVIAKTARDLGILTVGVVTKPFHFEGQRRMRIADGGITELQKCVDTLLIIPNQNLFRVANEKTTFADAFALADQVLYSGVACITDLMVKEGLINLDFADVRAVMREMGKAMMGTGEAEGDKRAMTAAEAAISNPLIDDASMKGARGLLISITGGRDLTLYEVDEAATRIREEVDQDANIIVGATFDESLDGMIRVSVVATGIDQAAVATADRAGGGHAHGGGRAAHPRREPAHRRTQPAARTGPDGGGCASGAAIPAAAPASSVASAPAAAPAAVNASIESAAKAAIAAAVEDVTIRPLAPKPSLSSTRPPASRKRPANRRSSNRRLSFRRRPERLPSRAAAHAAARRTAGPGAERNSRAAWRIARGRSSRKAAHVAIAAVGFGRPRTPRPGRDGDRLAGRADERPVGGPVSPERLTGRPMPRPSQPRPNSSQELPVSDYARRVRTAGPRPARTADPCA